MQPTSNTSQATSPQIRLELNANSKGLQEAVDNFYGQIDCLSKKSETLSILLSEFMENRKNDTHDSRGYIIEVATDTTDILAFLARLSDLHSKRNEILYFP